MFDFGTLAQPALTAVIAAWGIAENRRNARLEMEREREADRIAGIVEERKELKEENRQLREDLRAEIERLKADRDKQGETITDLLVQLATAQAAASTATERYEREVANNLPRETELASLRDEVGRLRAEVAGLRAAQVTQPVAA